MSASIRDRLLLIAGLMLVAAVSLVPSVTELPGWWPGFFPSDRVRLGLDLRGGTHLVLGVEAEKAVEASVEQMMEDVRRELQRERIALGRLEREGTTIRMRLIRPDKRTEAADLIAERFGVLEAVEDAETEPGGLVYRLDPNEARGLRESAVKRSVETIRNRVDQFGVEEPVVQRRGDTDILVQLPDIQDPERAKELIGRTGLLEFKLVERSVNPTEATSTQLDPDEEVRYGSEDGTRTAYVVKKRALLTGEVVSSAERELDPEDPIGRNYRVAFRLNDRGARVFEAVTAENVGRPLAIILDGTVESAPRIRERIPGGRGVIEGAFTPEEAQDLAIVLRSGKLPAPVLIEEERTVGPSLGQDSIRRGKISMIVGSVLVVLFMVAYYRLSGLIADLALVLNVFFVLAVLAFFRATLTLPGIAGLILTVGMAVDANVIIFERIREELRLGKTPHAAVAAGYSRALRAIVDANVTTIIAAVLLFQFGTGPVQGFAVTLSVGVATSLFTAMVVTRLIYDIWLTGRPVARLSI